MVSIQSVFAAPSLTLAARFWKIRLDWQSVAVPEAAASLSIIGSRMLHASFHARTSQNVTDFRFKVRKLSVKNDNFPMPYQVEGLDSSIYLYKYNVKNVHKLKYTPKTDCKNKNRSTEQVHMKSHFLSKMYIYETDEKTFSIRSCIILFFKVP